jgi:hypothetical protein
MVEPMVRPMARIAVLCAALGAVATTVAAAPCDELPARVNAHGPRELSAMWRQLGVRSRLFESAATASLRATRRDLGRPDPRESVLVLDIRDRAGEDWQHLVFLQSPGRCRFVGAVDAPGQGGEPPKLRLVRLPVGQAGLAVRARVRGGTGLALYRERWYSIDDNMGGLERAPHTPPRSGRPGEPGPPLDLARVLDYPAEGHMVGWPSTFDRSFSTRVYPGEGPEEVRIDFVASYTSGSYVYWMPVEPLFTATRTAVYTWKPHERRFVLDPVRSDVDEDEIEGIFYDAEEQFLRHNVRDLAPLAGRANERQRTWLRHFLDTVADSPEKRAVMENLR